MAIDGGIDLVKFDLIESAGGKLSTWQKLQQGYAAGQVLIGGSVLFGAAVANVLEQIFGPPPPPPKAVVIYIHKGPPGQ